MVCHVSCLHQCPTADSYGRLQGLVTVEMIVFEALIGRSKDFLTLRLEGREEGGERRVHEGFAGIMKVCAQGERFVLFCHFSPSVFFCSSSIASIFEGVIPISAGSQQHFLLGRKKCGFLLLPPIAGTALGQVKLGAVYLDFIKTLILPEMTFSGGSHGSGEAGMK